jgi:hypothetical protein
VPADAEEDEENLVEVFPYGWPELLFYEVTRMYQPTRVFELNGGVGKLPIACLRLNIMVHVWVRSSLHEQLNREYMTAVIVDENIDRIDKGLLNRRFLNRTRSLDGYSAAGSQGGAPPLRPHVEVAETVVGDSVSDVGQIERPAALDEEDSPIGDSDEE